MSTNVKGIAEIELRSDRFKKPAQEVTRQFGEMERKGKQSMQGMQQSTEKTAQSVKQFETKNTQSMQSIQQSTTKTAQSFTQFSTTGKSSFDSIATSVDKSKNAVVAMGTAAIPPLDNTANSMRRLGAETRKSAAELNAAKTATLGMVGSLAGLATSFVALETTFTNLPKRAKAIEQSEVGMERARNLLTTKTIALDKAELKLQKLREKGLTQSAEMEIAMAEHARLISEISTAEADLIVKTTDLELKHADMADTMKLMATSIFTTFLTAGTSIVIMLNGMASQLDMTTGAFVRHKLSVVANSRVLQFLKIDLVNARANFLGYSSAAAMSSKAGIVAATGIKRLGLAFKGLFTAMGPVGWAVLGITAVWEAWNSNLFGFQNVMHDVTQFLKDSFQPVLQAIADLVGWFTGQTIELTDAWQDFSNIVFPPLYEELQEADAATEELTQDTEALNAALAAEIDVMAELGTGIAHVGAVSAHLGSDMESVSKSILKMTTVHNEFWTKQVEEFDENNELLQGYLHIANGAFESQLEHFAKAMIVNMDALKENADDLTDAFGKKAVDQWVQDWEPWVQKQIELFGPEATRKKIDSFTELDEAHRNMIKNMVEDNDKMIASNEALGRSYDDIKKNQISNAIEVEQTLYHIQNRLDREAAHNRALGVDESRNIAGDFNIRRALGMGETTFGQDSAFVARAGQFDNPFGIDPSLTSDRYRILSEFRQRNNRNNRRFAEDSPSGSSRQYGGTSSYAGRTLTRAKGKKGKKYRGPDRSKFLSWFGLSRYPSDLLEKRLVDSLVSGNPKVKRGGGFISGNPYHTFRHFGQLMHRATFTAFGPNHKKIARLRKEFLEWWRPTRERILERKAELDAYKADRPVAEFDWGYVDVFAWDRHNRQHYTMDTRGNIKFIAHKTGADPTYVGRRYGVEDLEGDRRTVISGMAAARRFMRTGSRHDARMRSSKEIRETLRAFRQETRDKTYLSIDRQYNIDIDPLRERQELHNRIQYQDRMILEAVAT